jgi:hypothetical protein
LSLVKKTINERDDQIQKGEYDSEIDETWVVLDRDVNRINNIDKSDFKNALDCARQNDIHVAYSNDSVELWFLLHFQDLWSATHRDDLSKLLSKKLGRKYCKTENIYNEIKPMRIKAIQRAEQLLVNNGNNTDANPSTTMHLLVNKLLNEPGFRE